MGAFRADCAKNLHSIPLTPYNAPDCFREYDKGDPLETLILTASSPYPPASGGAIRAYGILKGLHEAGHHITLVTFGDESTDVDPLRRICDLPIVIPPPTRTRLGRIVTLLTGQADIATRLYSPHMEMFLFNLIRMNHFDLIQFEGIEVACYLPIVKETGTKAKLCFDTFNAEADLQKTIFEIDRSNITRLPMALYSYIQSRRIHQYEGDLCRIADMVVAVSDEDAAILGNYREDDKTYVVPSGIFVDDYKQPDKQIDLPDNSLVFTGKMDYRPNVDAMLWFADEILPHIDNAHLTIVGQKPHARIQHLPERNNITLTGWVDTVPPYLHTGDVYIAPLRMGSGTRLKILEALASGCAIVATPIAASGLNDEIKSAMVIADSEMDFANAVNALLQDPPRRNALGKQAQKVVKQHYDWSVLIPRLLKAYQEVGIGT